MTPAGLVVGVTEEAGLHVEEPMAEIPAAATTPTKEFREIQLAS